MDYNNNNNNFLPIVDGFGIDFSNKGLTNQLKNKFSIKSSDKNINGTQLRELLLENKNHLTNPVNSYSIIKNIKLNNL